MALTVAAEPPSPVEPAAVVTPVVVSGPAALPAPSPPLEAPPSEVPAPAVAPERPKLREAPVAWDEPQLIERARKALGADPRRAFSLTQEYERRFPGGAMSVEREVIALEALARLGQREEARRRALSFEAAHPSSIHLPRVRALLAKLGPP